MSETIERFTVFLASPGDVAAERKAVEKAVEEINRTYGEPEGFVLTLKRWETHTRPAPAPRGGSSQDVIDAQIGDYDLFVGLMWTRFGTPTKKAGSGTEQEYDAARKAGRRRRQHPLKVMFYFRSGTAKVKTIDPDQLKAVLAFKKKVFKDNLAREYDTPAQFAPLIREHLTHEARSLLGRRRAASARTKRTSAAAPPPAGVPAVTVPAQAKTPKATLTPAPKTPRKRTASAPKKPRGPRTPAVTPVRKLLTDADREAFARRAFRSVRLSVARAAASFLRGHPHATLATRNDGPDAFTVKGQVEGHREAHYRLRLEKDRWQGWALVLESSYGEGWDGAPLYQHEKTYRIEDDAYVCTIRNPDLWTSHGSSADALRPADVADAVWSRINTALGQRR